MRNLIAICGFSIFIFSCSDYGQDKNKIDSARGGLERLMKYYRIDTTDAAGNYYYHTIPEVQLTSQDGKPFATSSYNGKVSIADFFFASCGGTCPRMTSQLSRVQAAFPNNPEFKIVSFTVDPVRDSVAALQAYAERFKADTAQWKFVTGPKKSLYDLARFGYFLPVEPGNGDTEDFIHSDQLILVDRNAIIRGYYNGTDSAAVDSLISDIRILLKEKK